MYHQSNWSRGTSFLLVFVAAFSLILGASMGSAEAASASLAWNAATGVSGYRIHYGTSSGNYTASSTVGNTTSSTVPNLNDGTRYYFAVTAYDSSGVESDYSNEVSYGGSSSCTYSISPSSASFASTGGTGTISVTATSGCSWSASTGVSWATISSGSTGTGSGTVKYSVAANTGAARTAAFDGRRQDLFHHPDRRLIIGQRVHSDDNQIRNRIGNGHHKSVGNRIRIGDPRDHDGNT